MLRFTLDPILSLLLWLMAAFIVIGIGPMFFPIMGSTVSFAALLWKLLGATLLLVVNLALLGRAPGVAVLGLGPSARAFGLLALGTLSGLLLVGLWLAVFRLLVPVQLAPGTITPRELLLSFLIYLFGALLEELAFRGHALLRLRERYGSVVAVLLVSVAFGVLHLPGMTGVNAIKIIALTGLSSSLFCFAYLASGSLWAAVGLHAGMNFMLHSLLGAGGGAGPSLLTPVYEQSAPPGFGTAFWCFILVQLVCGAGVILVWTRHNATRGEQPR